MKNAWLTTAILLSCSQVAFGDCEEACDSALKNPCEPLCPSEGPNWIITPDAGPFVNCGMGIFVTGEFIYWIVHEDHLAFALLEDPTGGGQKGKVFYPDFRFEPGFKVGLGYMLDCDGWDLYANYTWLRTRNTKNSVTPSGNLIIQDYMWVTNANFANRDNLTINRESFNWEHDFNALDLELGRNFYMSPCLKLRPFMGFKGTWQKQTAIATADETNIFTSENFTSIGKHDNDFWGFGIRVGIDTSWQLTQCFSLYGESAAAALWGEFDTDSKVVQTSNATGAISIPINTQLDFHTVRPVFEWRLGLRYEDWFCCDDYHWAIEAGWEEQVWPGQNEFNALGFQEPERGGAMNFQGLSILVRFDF